MTKRNQERLFDFMVPVRSQVAEGKNMKENSATHALSYQQPHLGLGFYSARLIAELNQGSIAINKNEAQTGVIAKVTIPLT